MKISEEDFAQLGLTEKDLVSALTEEAYQAYKESPSLRRLRKAIRESVLSGLEEKAEQMNFKESLVGKDVRGHLNAMLRDQELAQIIQDYERSKGEIGGREVTAVFENKIAESLFRGLSYNGQKITLDLLRTKDIVPSMVEITAANMDGALFARRRDRMLQDEKTGETIDFFNTQFGEKIKNIAEGIKEAIQEGASTQKEVDGFLEIRDDILSFMGATSKNVLKNKDKIYAYWADIHKKHKDLVTAVDALTEGAENEEMSKLKTAFEEIRDKPYIVEYAPMSVKETHDQLLALDLLEAFQKRIGRSVDDNEEFLTTVEGALEADPNKEEEEIQDVVDDFSSFTSEKLDPISRYYISKMLNGIFVSSAMKESIIEEVNNLATTFGMDEIDLKNLKKFLSDIPDFTVTNSNVMLPSQFSTGFLMETSKDGKIEYGEKLVDDINSDYSLFIERLATVIETGAFRIGRRGETTTTITGTAGEAKRKIKDKAKGEAEKRTYSASFTSRGMSWKQLEEGQAKKVNAVINALNDYLFVPISNKIMTLGHSFRDLRRTKAFKIISVYADTRTEKQTSPSTKAVSVLYQRLEKRGQATFTSKQYDNLNNFMDSLRTQFDFGKIRNSANKAFISLNQIYRGAGADFLKNMKKGFGKLIGAIHKKTVAKGRIEPILRDFDVSPEEVDVDYDISDIVAFTEVIDFMLENKSALGKPFERKIKKLDFNFNRLSKSKDIRNKILEAHDAFRILKGMPIYYGRGDLSDIDDVSSVANFIRNDMGINIVANEIVKMVEEVDSFANIAKNIGVTEETVYFVKANFR